MRLLAIQLRPKGVLHAQGYEVVSLIRSGDVKRNPVLPIVRSSPRVLYPVNVRMLGAIGRQQPREIGSTILVSLLATCLPSSGRGCTLTPGRSLVLEYLVAVGLAHNVHREWIEDDVVIIQIAEGEEEVPYFLSTVVTIVD